jgi:nicotinate-nucleotide adenylyltransferase
MGLTPQVQRIGVFGGAFDPPHNAHVALARTAIEQLGLDELRIFPTGQAWHKPRALSATEHRLAMAHLAFDDLARVRVDARETQRSGPTYTIDTLLELQQEYSGAQLYLLLGQDQAQALPKWHRWQEVLQLAIICVAVRDADTPCAGEFEPLSGLPEVPQGRFQRLGLAPMAVGSTRIRAMLATGEGIAPLVPQAVARYISLHHLYQNP